jgi:hypothetical protein
MKAKAMKKKIWFFVEGDSEENFIIKGFWRCRNLFPQKRFLPAGGLI